MHSWEHDEDEGWFLALHSHDDSIMAYYLVYGNHTYGIRVASVALVVLHCGREHEGPSSHLF